MINYRKAKKEEVKCCNCKYHKEPDWTQKRIRCFVYNRIAGNYAVGKNNTCDLARVT